MSNATHPRFAEETQAYEWTMPGQPLEPNIQNPPFRLMRIQKNRTEHDPAHALTWPNPQQSDLYNDLKSLRQEPRAAYRMRARAHRYLDQIADLPPDQAPYNRLDAVAAWLGRQQGPLSLSRMVSDLEHLLAAGLYDLVNSEGFINRMSMDWTRFCALILSGRPDPETGNALMTRLRVYDFLRRLTDNDEDLEHQHERERAMEAAAVFPDEVTPGTTPQNDAAVGWANLAGLGQTQPPHGRQEPAVDETQTLIPASLTANRSITSTDADLLAEPAPIQDEESQGAGPLVDVDQQRMMIEFIIQDPAAKYRARLARHHGIHMDPIPSLAAMGIEGPRDISRKNYQELARVYHTGDLEPPPAMTRVLKAGFHGPGRVQTRALLVPSGYRLQSGRVDYRIADGSYSLSGFADSAGFCHRGGDRGRTIQAAEGSRDLQFKNPFKQAVPIVVECAAPQYKVDIRITCEAERGQELYRAWQVRVYERVINANVDCTREYEAWFNIYFQHLTAGDARQIITTELQHAALAVLRRIHVQSLGQVEAGRQGQGEPGYLRVLNHAFEWDQMNPTFLPWRLGDALQWPKPGLDSDADRFQGFLRTKTARVLIPVRPGYELAVLYFLNFGYLWPPLEGTPPVSEASAAMLPSLLRHRPVQRMEGGVIPKVLPRAAGQ